MALPVADCRALRSEGYDHKKLASLAGRAGVGRCSMEVDIERAERERGDESGGRFVSVYWGCVGEDERRLRK